MKKQKKTNAVLGSAATSAVILVTAAIVTGNPYVGALLVAGAFIVAASAASYAGEKGFESGALKRVSECLFGGTDDEN